MKYALPNPPQAPWEKPLKLAIIVGLHGLLLYVALTTTLRPQVMAVLDSLDLRLIEEKSSAPEPEKPKPPVPRPQAKQPEVTPEPVLTAAAEAPVAASFSVPEQPPAPPAPPTPEPTPVVAARFDADYLHNPKPSYPMASRRNHEEGKLLLKVLVSSEGLAKTVLVQKSTGYSRLDDVAVEAVRTWRFVPARRGSDAVEDWVLIPFTFDLTK